MMKRPMFNLFCAVFMGAAAGLLIAPSPGRAEVNVSITVPLPPLVLPAPPGLIVIPGTYVYYPPEVGVNIFFYQGYWYRPYQGGWYRANGYNGPWHTLNPYRVPRALIRVPQDYRRMPPVHERLPYSTVRHNWRTWENERHWDHAPYGRGEHGEHHGRGHEEGHGRHD
jgi:hypothetical protein